MNDTSFLDEVDGVVVPGGFGSRGDRGQDRDNPKSKGEEYPVFRPLPWASYGCN